MKRNKRLILISEDAELYKAFRRALKTISDAEIGMAINANVLQSYIANKSANAILLYTRSRDEKYRWLWEELIVGLQCNMPIVAIGYHKINISEDLRDIVFEKEETRKSYRYLQIPLSIMELSNALYEVKPFQRNRFSYLIKNFCDWKGILNNILTHEIPNYLRTGKKDEAINLYKKIKEILYTIGASNKIITECNTAIVEIASLDLGKDRMKLIDRANKIAERIRKI